MWPARCSPTEIGSTGFADDAVADGLTHAVVMGMGGSSLFPEVLARTFPPRARPAPRSPCSTRPTRPRSPGSRRRVPLDQTLFIASSKSGSTVETRSHLAHFWDGSDGPSSSPSSPTLAPSWAHLARERGFREIFENRPDIGGRYSALSYFGLVPAALAGVDWTGSWSRPRSTSRRSSGRRDPAANPGLRLGAIFGAAVKAGRDKLTLVIDAGRHVRAVARTAPGRVHRQARHRASIPVAGEPLGPPTVYGDDRLFVVHRRATVLARPRVLADAGHPVVELALDDPLRARRSGAPLGVRHRGVRSSPRHQPVRPAERGRGQGGDERRCWRRVRRHRRSTPLADLLAQVAPGDYVAVQAFVDPGDPVVERLQEARIALRDRLHVATTVRPRPRFLHSTGQLHKGGPPTGVFVQVVGDDHDGRRRSPASPSRSPSWSTLRPTAIS